MDTLSEKLVAVFIAFVAVLAAVIWMAFRERRLARAIRPGDLEAGRAADGRVLVTIFGGIGAGMLLTLAVAWLVFL
ncbi:MAG: hypothetical protein AB7P08_13895 [Burkholderiales bacterium]